MTKAIIIDDELHCIETLKEKIKIYCPTIEVIDSFVKPQSALDYLMTESPDIIFLDIEMPVINGFTLLEKLKDINFRIVFTTAYDQYAIKAIKFSAFDYLLKPIDKDDLMLVADRINLVTKKSTVESQIGVLLQQIKNTNNDQLKISIHTSEGIVFPLLHDIIRIESSSNYSVFYFNDGSKKMVSKTLKDFEEILCHHDFFRIHNSHLINLSRVKTFHKTDGGLVEMYNGDKVEVSRRRKDEFINALESKFLTVFK
jgi:two-component system, LytTR family, response regulator